MLIPLKLLCEKLNLNIRGVLHIGAHECEEQKYYLEQGIDNNNIYWIEAIDEKVNLMKKKDKNLKIYQALIDIKDGEEVERFQADLSFKLMATKKEIQNIIDELLMKDF